MPESTFSILCPSPAESVLPFACPTPFARLESSFWPKRSFEESPLLLPIKAEQMILPSLFKIEQSLHSSATTLSFVRCPMMESSPYLSRPVTLQSGEGISSSKTLPLTRDHATSETGFSAFSVRSPSLSALSLSRKLVSRFNSAVNFLGGGGGHGHRRILAVQKMNFLHPTRQARSVPPSVPPSLGRYTFPNVPALITTLILTGREGAQLFCCPFVSVH